MSNMTSKEIDITRIQKKKKPLIMIIVIISITLASGIATWFLLKDQIHMTDGDEKKPVVPTSFIDLDVFTVNLQPEDGNHYLQVGLTIKILQTKVGDAINKQMPEIRNRLLLLLSNKKPSEISTADGKKQLSTEITNEIRASLGSTAKQQEILGVLFTSFVIQ